MYVVWRHGGGAERLWSEKRSVLRCPMQRTALPLAARCNYVCSALHLKSGCSADSWGMGPASFSQRFPLLLPSLSFSSSIAFHFFSHRFPLLLSSFSVSSLISFRSFSHRFPLLLPSFSTSPLIFLHILSQFFSASSLIPFLFFSHHFPLVSVLRFRLRRIVWQSPAGHGAMQGFAVLLIPVSALARCGTA